MHPAFKRAALFAQGRRDRNDNTGGQEKSDSIDSLQLDDGLDS